MARFDVTEFEWSVIQPSLPNKPRGVACVDDRRQCLAAAEGLTPVNRILHSATRRIFPLRSIVRDTIYLISHSVPERLPR